MSNMIGLGFYISQKNVLPLSSGKSKWFQMIKYSLINSNNKNVDIKSSTHDTFLE